MSTTKAAKSPSHEVFAVTRKNEGDKGYWQNVGALWAHEDGEGFNLRLELLPLNGAGYPKGETEGSRRGRCSMKGITLGPSRVKKAGANAPADTPKKQRYRILMAQTIFHMIEVEAESQPEAENLAFASYHMGTHNCRKSLCRCTDVDLLEGFQLMSDTRDR